MTKKPSEKNKAWEKERRDRLNKSFENLAKLLPNYDPSITWTKIEIIQKSIAHIEHLHQRTEKYIAAKDPELLNNHKELTEVLKRYQIRNLQLSELLKAANITLPPFNLPKFCGSNSKIYEQLKELENNIENNENNKTKTNDENVCNTKIKRRANIKEDNLLKTDQILKINNNKATEHDNIIKKTKFVNSKQDVDSSAIQSNKNLVDISKESEKFPLNADLKFAEANSIDVTTSCTLKSSENITVNLSTPISITSTDIKYDCNPKTLISTSTASPMKNVANLVKSPLQAQQNSVVLSTEQISVPFITLPPGNLPTIIKFENLLNSHEKKLIADANTKPQTGIKTIKILPQPTVKLYYPSVDGKIPIPPIRKKTIIKTKKVRKKRKPENITTVLNNAKKIKIFEEEENTSQEKIEVTKEINVVTSLSAYCIEKLCENDKNIQSNTNTNEKRNETNTTCDKLIEDEERVSATSNKQISTENDAPDNKTGIIEKLNENESIKDKSDEKIIENADSIQLKLPNVNAHIRTVSPTAAFLKSFPKVASASKNDTDIDKDGISIPNQSYSGFCNLAENNRTNTSSISKYNDKKSEKHVNEKEETKKPDLHKVESAFSTVDDIANSKNFSLSENNSIIVSCENEQPLKLSSVNSLITTFATSISTQVKSNVESNLLYTRNSKPTPIFSPYFDEPIPISSTKNIPVSISNLNLSTQGPICTPLPLENTQKNKKIEKAPPFNFSIPSIASHTVPEESKNDCKGLADKIEAKSVKENLELKENIENKINKTRSSSEIPNRSCPTSTNSLVSDLFSYTPLTLPNMWSSITTPVTHCITESSHTNYTKPFYLDSLPVFNPNLGTTSISNNTESSKTFVSNAVNYTSPPITTVTCTVSNTEIKTVCKNKTSPHVPEADKVLHVNIQKSLDNKQNSECSKLTSSKSIKNTELNNQCSNKLNSYPSFTFSLTSTTQSLPEMKSSISTCIYSQLPDLNSQSFSKSVSSNTASSLSANPIVNTSTSSNINSNPLVTSNSVGVAYSNTQSTFTTFSKMSSGITSFYEKNTAISNNTIDSHLILPSNSNSKVTSATLLQPSYNISTLTSLSDSLVSKTQNHCLNQTDSKTFCSNTSSKANLSNKELLSAQTTGSQSSATHKNEKKSKEILIPSTINNNKDMCNITKNNLRTIDSIFTTCPPYIPTTSNNFPAFSKNSTTNVNENLNENIIADNKNTKAAISKSTSHTTDTLTKVSNNTTNLEKTKFKPELIDTLAHSNIFPKASATSTASNTSSDFKIDYTGDSVKKSSNLNNVKVPNADIPPWTLNIQNNLSNNYVGFENPLCSYSGFNYTSNYASHITQSEYYYPTKVSEKQNKTLISESNHPNSFDKTGSKGKDIIYSVTNLFDTKHNEEVIQSKSKGNSNTSTYSPQVSSKTFNANNKCDATQIQTSDCTLPELPSSNISTMVGTPPFKNVKSTSSTSTISSSRSSLTQNFTMKASENINSNFIKSNFVSNGNSKADLISMEDSNLSNSKQKLVSKSKMKSNEISTKLTANNLEVNSKNPIIQNNEVNNKISNNISVFNTANASLTTLNSHKVSQTTNTITKSNEFLTNFDSTKNLNLPSTKVTSEGSGNKESFAATKNKPSTCLYGSNFPIQSHEFSTSNMLYSSINNNLGMNSESYSNKYQKENMDPIISNSNSFANNTYSSSNHSLYANSKNYYYPIQGENCNSYNNYSMTPIISQSNSYNLDQTNNNSCLISYPNLKTDLPWMAAPPPTISQTSLSTTDYNAFTFSLTPTTSSYVTTSNHYATTNFSFSLTTPKTSSSVTSINDKIKNFPSKTGFYDQTASSFDFGLGFNTVKHPATEPTNFQFSLQKSPNKNNSITNSNVEKSNYNFSIDSQLNSKNPIIQTNSVSRNEINSNNQEFKVPSTIKSKNKIASSSIKTEKRTQSNQNKSYYDCEMNRTSSTIKTLQKSTINWMTTGPISSQSSSECNPSVYQDFNNTFNVSNNNNDFHKKSNYYPSIDENLVTWSPSKIFDQSVQNYNNQNNYGTSNDFQIDNDVNNYLSNSSGKQIKSEKSSSKEQNTSNNFFSIKQFVDQTSSSVSNETGQKIFNNYHNTHNQQQQNQQIDQNQINSQQNEMLKNKNDIVNNQKKVSQNKLKDVNYKENIKTNSHNQIKFDESNVNQHSNQQQHQSQKIYSKSNQSLSCNYSAESLISKKEKSSKILPQNCDTTFDNNTSLYNPCFNSLTQTSELIDQQNYNTNYFSSYSSSNNNHLTSEIDYLGASILHSTDFNNDSYNKSNSTAFLKDTKKSNFISNYSTSSTIPSSHFPHSHHISYESTNYLNVPPLISSGTTNENCESSSYSYNNNNNNNSNTNSNNNNNSSFINNSTATVTNNYQYNSWHNSSKSNVIGCLQNNCNTGLNVQFPQQQNLINSNLNTEQMPINTHSQNASVGNLPNFNLSSICPEINDKVCSNNNNVW
ncbi:probable serine/threonine-protein kinase DDB_G0282963 [Condylostylus longicornis]|uniref:probable serine/threonine-protein kinase DDB_G0282963 n=1 Tax=Condylostylus longicornis TaxID=2530218 RepID=UPI00244E2A15|nr:probable serine/threonine-protein kinase DDB_G0282963 [Condylostylus longicornis]